jgi:hypothetical protein
MLTVHVPWELVQPVQPVNREPLAATAVRITEVPASIAAEQLLGQLMLPTELVIEPGPVAVTVRMGMNVAVAILVVSTVTLQGFVEWVQAPDHPLNA